MSIDLRLVSSDLISCKCYIISFLQHDTSQTEHKMLGILAVPGLALTRHREPKLCADQCGRGNKVCSARPISSQPVGRPSIQWGCQTNSTGQQCTAWHHFLPLTHGPNPAGPPAFFRCRTAALLSPLHVSTYRYSRPAQLDINSMETF